MIKNIILDMGGVCCNWNPIYLSEQLTPIKEEQFFIQQYVFGSKEWPLLDLGNITYEEAYNILSARHPGYEKTIELGLYHWHEYFHQFDEMYEFVLKYKKLGYEFYLLSNASLAFYEYYQERPVLMEMKERYVSCDHHLVKPNKEIYEDFLKTYNLIGDECIFVDDLEANAKASELVGIHGLHYHGKPQEIEEFLNKLNTK